MERRKVLMVLNRLEIGGAETHVMDLSAALQQLGWEVMVASSGGVFERTLRDLGIRHFLIPSDSRDLVQMRRAAKKLEQIIQTEKPAIVHAHARIPAFLCGQLQRKLGFAFVTTAHWTFEVNSLLRLMSNWGQQTIAVSKDIQDYLIDNYSVSAGKIHVIPNGIDTRRFSPSKGDSNIRKEFGISPQAETVVCVTRLHTTRADSARLLVQIAPELAAMRPGIRILIVGDGECLQELQEKAAKINKEQGDPCLILTGGRTDIPDILQAADVVVGVSRAALEAMSCEKPVILCGNEGYGGIVREEYAQRYMETNYCCRDYPKSTAEKLENDIMTVLSMSPEQRAALGRDGRRIITRDFSEQTMALETAQIYDLALHPQKSVVVSGYYGYRNLGDDAILEMICKDLAGAQALTVLSRRPKETARKYGVNTVHRFRVLQVLHTIREADLLLSGGGSILQDKTSTRSLLYYLQILKTAQRAGVSTVVYANGVGPIRSKWNQKRTARVLKNVDLISLRDEDSGALVRQMCRDMNISVTADPVFRMEASPEAAALEILRQTGIPNAAKMLAVCLRKTSRTESLHLAELLDRIARTGGYTPVFIGMQKPYDMDAARITQGMMTEPSYLLDRSVSGPDMIALLCRTQGIVSMRFHALVFGAVAGIPVIGFDEDPKLVSLLRALGAPKAIPTKTFVPETAAEEICAVLQRGTVPNISRQIELSRQDPRNVQSLLDRKDAKLVVHIIGGGDTGGAKTHILLMLQGLIRQGCRVRLVCFLEGEFVQEARRGGIPTMVLPRNNVPGNIRWLTRYIRRHQADVIHCHGAKANMYGALLTSRVDIPVVTTVHSDPELDYLGRPAADATYGAINRNALKKIPWHVCVSEELRKEMLERGLPEDRLFLIHNGVDFENCGTVVPRAQWFESMGIQVPSDAVVFGTAARLTPVKDISTMITAFSAVVEKYPQARLVIAGDGEERKKLQHEAEKKCPANTVFFVGWLQDTASFYHAVDVNVLSSLSEGFPYAIPEGGRMHCATIATRVGSIPAIIADEAEGLLFEPGDAGTLADLMCRMIEKPAEREKFSDAIYMRIRQHFSLESMVRAQMGIYDTVCKQVGAKRSR